MGRWRIACGGLCAREDTSRALNGRYRFTITGRVLTISDDAAGWFRKTVTTEEGDVRSEPSIVIVEAIKTGWYVPLNDEAE